MEETLITEYVLMSNISLYFFHSTSLKLYNDNVLTPFYSILTVCYKQMFLHVRGGLILN